MLGGESARPPGPRPVPDNTREPIRSDPKEDYRTVALDSTYVEFRDMKMLGLSVPSLLYTLCNYSEMLDIVGRRE